MSRSQVFSLLDDQHESISNAKTVKLNSLPSVNTRILIDLIDEYLSSFHPPLVVERLTLQDDFITEIPPNIIKISKHLKYLDLHHNNISHISSNILPMLKSVEILDLSSNQISLVPESITNLSSLKVLSLKNNNIKYLTPALGELEHLNLIEVSNNPLRIPSFDLIRSFQGRAAEKDWVSQLKIYLLSNRHTINAKIEESRDPTPSHYQTMDPHNTEYQVASLDVQSSQNASDVTKSKSTKASKRMGFIVKKLEETTPEDDLEDEKPITKTSIPRPIIHDGAPHSASAAETKFVIASPPPPSQSAVTSSTAPSSASVSPSNEYAALAHKPSQNPRPIPRSRSNSMKEIDKILEKNENVDTEHKSNAYFKRLSTLQELPVDESEIQDSPTSNQKAPRQTLDPGYRVTSSTSVSVPRANTSVNASSPDSGSPIRPAQLKKHINPNIVKVSRKVLFSFSELHSSIRRFTGFCSDKKITMKMVSLLYTTKSNIDSLVENLEVMEESGENAEQIAETLHACITSFRSIMDLLSENLTKFVSKIDVCFIRMLYLSVFGSINELKNAHVLLTKHKGSDFKSKLSINTNVGSSFAEVDEKLYVTVESAIANAQSIFTELNKDVHRGAGANAGSVSTNVATKIKDLSSICASSLEITKRLNTKLIAIRNEPSHGTRKQFAEDTNQFLKSIVSILAAVKSIVVDIPILEDVRAPMSSLTKTAKEVTYMLEISSYKTLLSDSGQGNQQVQSASTGVQPPTMFTPVSGRAPTLLSTSALSSGPAPVRNPVVPPPNLSTANLQDTATGSFAPVSGPLTAPPQSSGQMFAKNGMNPFDKLILSKHEET
ncbi:SOG2 [Candida theae]|uniref:SOG2 n=1 Tax=Candida theae TaxID=1198502 RepID=A0AAD5BEB2_9ASCO|nr:SOG2 [Candida theae]KAI5958032.1 SOG2 [Candida theae]